MTPTREELLDKAEELEITGRHSMKKEELQEAINKALEEQGEAATEVSEEDQAELEESSDDAAAEVEERGETGTPVEQAATKPASKGESSGRGVGFFR